MADLTWKDRGPAFRPIAMYVYHRPRYWSQTLGALGRVRHIGQALLIVSMDGLFDDMIDLILAVRPWP